MRQRPQERSDPFGCGIRAHAGRSDDGETVGLRAFSDRRGAAQGLGLVDVFEEDDERRFGQAVACGSGQRRTAARPRDEDVAADRFDALLGELAIVGLSLENRSSPYPASSARNPTRMGQCHQVARPEGAGERWRSHYEAFASSS